MKHKALFLDRDGVINIEKDYLYKIQDFEFMDGIFDLCHFFQKKDYKIIIVTNQSGIARDYYTEEDFQTLTRWMIKAFREEGIIIQGVYHCPHHPDISGSCECRKPKPGMILDAMKEFNIDADNSLLVGDKERDIESAHRAGIKQSYLFGTQDSQTKALHHVGKLQDIIKFYE